MRTHKGKIIVLTLKFFVSAAVLMMLLIRFSNFKDLSISLPADWNRHLLGLLLVLALMPLNWFLECVKWKLILKQLGLFGWKEVVSSVLCGLAISNLTPGRSGEFIGRALATSGHDKIKISELYVVGSWAQQICTLFLGSISLLLLIAHYDVPGYLTIVLCFFSILTLILLLMYFGMSNISFYISERYPDSRISGYLSVLQNINYSTLFVIMLLSLARYILFSAQFFLLFRFFDLPLSTSQAMVSIPLIFMGGSYIPTVALLEMGVKTAVSIFVINLLGISNIDELALLSASGLWIINIAIPSLIGTALIWRIRLVKE